MKRFILLSFVFMGWAFYEFTGGAEFVPQPPARLAKYEADKKPPNEAVAQTSASQKIDQTTTTVQIIPQSEDVTLASLDLSDTQAVLTSVTGTEPLRLAPRSSLFSAPSPTPTNDLAIFSLTQEAEPEVRESGDTKSALDLRKVRSARVNMRNGPGTQYSVLSKLKRGDKVHVLQESDNGWVKLKVLEGGRIGWMSASLLANAN